MLNALALPERWNGISYTHAFDRNFSSNGRGMPVDVGVGVVIGPTEIGSSANNLRHRMVWRGVSHLRNSLPKPVIR